MNTKKIRNVTVFLAIISFAFLFATTWFQVDLGDWGLIAEPVAGVLIAFGILAETGKEPEPITKQSILEKIKSPVMWGAMIVLLQFISARVNGVAVTIITQVEGTIRMIIIFIGIWNNPNNRNALR